MPKIPEVIYLQWFDEDGKPDEEVTWCQDEINDSDIAYIRKDVVTEGLTCVMTMLGMEVK